MPGPGALEVRIAGRGVVKDGQRVADPGTRAHCDLCQSDVEVAAQVTPDGRPGGDGLSAAAAHSFACKDCLRQRLEAMTVAAWVMREPDRSQAGGLPWGKVSG
jgi:hypothetical protein